MKATHAAVLVLFSAAQPGCYISMDPYVEAPPPTVASVAPGAPIAEPTGEVTVADFYEPLSAWGDWIDAPPYGQVWVPRQDVAGEDFVPYTTGGQWVSTDTGWVFQSRWDNDWGWATYHYGRWAHAEDLGWYWVPDVEWGPAWVDWRYGGAYVGWAPMAPVGMVLMPSSYVFVETRYINDPYVARYRVPAQHVAVVYGATIPSGQHIMRGSVRWSLGPPMAHIASAAVAVRPVHYSVPARGEIRARASAMRTRGVTNGRPRSSHRSRSRRR